MNEVYRVDIAKNSDHRETWIVRFDACFDLIDEAELYVIRQNALMSSEMVQVANTLPECRKWEFYRTFCFDPEYASRRRYHFGKPSIKLITSQLNADGVTKLKF